MASRRLGPWAALWIALFSALPAHGVGPIERVDTTISELARWPAEQLGDTPVLGELLQRVRLSGNVTGAVFEAGSGSQVGTERTSLWDARLFLDVDLAEDVALGSRPLLGAVGVSVEWEFRRAGRKSQQLGEAYLDLQKVGGSPWLNAQIGRFQIPVGEAYLRYGKALRDAPFITEAVAGSWWWDEGVRIHGSDLRGRFGYVASVSEGTTPLHFGAGPGQGTLKLFVQPRPWLRVSTSVLYSGATGRPGDPAQGALWLGETWARALGSGPPVPVFSAGQVVAPGPDRIDSTLYLGADVVARHERGLRLWLSYGNFEIDSSGGGAADRRLHAWIAELIVEGRLLGPATRNAFLALRASGLGTYDDGRGYLADIRTIGRLGYNTRSLEAWSLGLGLRLGEHATVRMEYTYQHFELVRGAASQLGPIGTAGFFAASASLHF